MKQLNTLIMVATALLAGLGAPIPSAAQQEASSAAQEASAAAQEAESKAVLEAEYRKALALAEQERQQARATLEKARGELETASAKRAQATRESEKARAAQEAEMQKMHEELNRARRQLQEASREISRVNREVMRARAREQSSNFVFRTSDQPVIGIVLGGSSDDGVKVLGVSPDGPSDKAGIEAGDVIVSLNGKKLGDIEASGGPRSGLKSAMRTIKEGEAVTVTVKRNDRLVDLSVVPELREPLSWETVTRITTAPSAPHAPGEPETVITVERIDVPEIDTTEMAEQIEKMRIEIEERSALAESGEFEPFASGYSFEFHDLSDLGNHALQDANIWFGLPLTRGLKLAEVDPALGEYFKTDRGVLVLEAKADNELELEGGDVILQVGDTQVNTPAEFMRALRDFEAGDELAIGIMRKRKGRTLKTVMPDRRTSIVFPRLDGLNHTITIASD